MANGKESFKDFYDNQIRGLNSLIEKAKILKISPSSSVVKCPNCGKPMVRRKSKNGYFWGCSGFPECKTTANDNKGKPDFSRFEGRNLK